MKIIHQYYLALQPVSLEKKKKKSNYTPAARVNPMTCAPRPPKYRDFFFGISSNKFRGNYYFIKTRFTIRLSLYITSYYRSKRMIRALCTMVSVRGRLSTSSFDFFIFNHIIDKNFQKKISIHFYIIDHRFLRYSFHRKRSV